MGTMPKKVTPASEFGKRLYELRKDRGLTQIELAETIGSTQRAISYYETVADYPPADVVAQLATALRTTTDQLLGLKKPKVERDDPDEQRLWRKFRQFMALSEKDRRAIIRMINSLGNSRTQHERRSA